jgi:hypothetical protein
VAEKYLSASIQTLASALGNGHDAGMTQEHEDIQVVQVDDVDAVEVVPGIVGRRLPASEWARAGCMTSRPEPNGLK